MSSEDECRVGACPHHPVGYRYGWFSADIRLCNRPGRSVPQVQRWGQAPTLHAFSYKLMAQMLRI